MGIDTAYTTSEPTRAEVDTSKGSLVIEFGTDWCGHCRAAQPLVATAFAEHPSIRHVKIEDGSGRPLGRSFRIKLWPTLIFFRDGLEIARLVRPQNADVIKETLNKIDSAQ